MKKIIFRTMITFLLLFIAFIFYFSFIGFETKKLNNQISDKLKSIDDDLEINLNKVKLILNPLRLNIKAKTLGPKLKHKNESVEFEYIQTNISIKSLIKNEFSISNLDASTKSLRIKTLISFYQSFNNRTELFILEKFIKKGFLIADIKINFDKEGKLNNNYKVNGFIKDTKINIFKKYKVKNLNFIFSLDNENLKIQDLEGSFNNLKFSTNKLNVKKFKDDFLFVGDFENKDINLDNEEINLIIKSYLPNTKIENIIFDSKNDFSFIISNNLKLKDFKIKSDLNIKELSIFNDLKIKSFFPNIVKKIKFSDQKLGIEYKKDSFVIKGSGNILLQDQKDQINYMVNIENDILNFDILFKVKKNPLILDILNYEKNINNNATIKIKGSKNLNNKTKFDLISLEEIDNKIIFQNLFFDEKLKIINLDNANFNFLDQTGNINKFNIERRNNDYYLQGSTLNADNLIENLIKDNDDSSLKFSNKRIKIFVKIEDLLLDKYYKLENFEGYLSIKNQEIINGNLKGSFSKKKKFNFTVKSVENKKITTLFLDEADTMVNRYKFIKGFKGGSLDFYSTSQNDETISKIKIYDFKLKELPALTKLLTLASLQGIVDLVSGEGISFDEFEMTFKNVKNNMSIEEVYAIGPAISILMNGYIEKNELISLRGTLVPATTINKVIGSIPILGNILVGSKTGEGVFGVSFKIKGPPKELETTVNPIKTLTPRFITRTLEKIKKN